MQFWLHRNLFSLLNYIVIYLRGYTIKFNLWLAPNLSSFNQGLDTFNFQWQLMVNSGRNLYNLEVSRPWFEYYLTTTKRGKSSKVNLSFLNRRSQKDLQQIFHYLKFRIPRHLKWSNHNKEKYFLVKKMIKAKIIN